MYLDSVSNFHPLEHVLPLPAKIEHHHLLYNQRETPESKTHKCQSRGIRMSEPPPTKNTFPADRLPREPKGSAESTKSWCEQPHHTTPHQQLPSQLFKPLHILAPGLAVHLRWYKSPVTWVPGASPSSHRHAARTHLMSQT